MINRAVAMLALTGLTLSCAGNAPAGPPMPAGLVSVTSHQVEQWVEATVRDSAPVRIRFQWNFRQETGNASGRGSVWIVPPDTLRLDFRGPLGSGSSAAAVVGEQEVWAVPEEEVCKLVPS
ncbi:MAG TPA: hypothetical protein PLL69_06915, partial [Gemmatimonadales bacterium]|nr:hypothetical protein [Gemmatimonadales bacterium]